MRYWHVEDIEDFEALRDLDGDLDAVDADRVRAARMEAFFVRRRLGAKIPQHGSDKAKTTALAAKRFANRVARRMILDAKQGTIVQYGAMNGSPALLAVRKNSILLDALVPNRKKNWLPMAARVRGRRTDEIVVSDFSFLKDPNATLEALRAIAEAERSCLSAKIHFADETCQDIGAWLVLAAMRQKMASIFSGGVISDEVSNVIRSLEMEKALAMRMPPPATHVSNVWSFPLKERRRAGTSTSDHRFLDPQQTEEVATELCEAIDHWLDACVKQALSRDGRAAVMTLVTEALDNAERHSRPEYENDGDWWMTGFMTRDDTESGPRFKCQLALLSIGEPISETILSCDSATKTKMEAYVAAHKKVLSQTMGHAERHLRTVYALQDFVSRDSEAHNKGRGGVGFGVMLQIFADLAGYYRDDVFARLSIVSGRTCVHLSRQECDHAASQSVGKPFNIWLNNEHDSDLAPREGAIEELEHDFKGTLVTMAFELDPDYLESSVDGTN